MARSTQLRRPSASSKYQKLGTLTPLPSNDAHETVAAFERRHCAGSGSERRLEGRAGGKNSNRRRRAGRVANVVGVWR